MAGCVCEINEAKTSPTDGQGDSRSVSPTLTIQGSSKQPEVDEMRMSEAEIAEKEKEDSGGDATTSPFLSPFSHPPFLNDVTLCVRSGSAEGNHLAEGGNKEKAMLTVTLTKQM